MAHGQPLELLTRAHGHFVLAAEVGVDAVVHERRPGQGPALIPAVVVPNLSSQMHQTGPTNQGKMQIPSSRINHVTDSHAVPGPEVVPQIPEGHRNRGLGPVPAQNRLKVVDLDPEVLYKRTRKRSAKSHQVETRPAVDRTRVRRRNARPLG